MKAYIEIPDSLLSDMLDDAGAGIAYWCCEATRRGRLTLRVQVDDGDPDRAGQWFDVDLERAFKLLPGYAGGRHLAAIVTENYDAETCDVLVQLGAFGEVTYG